MSYILRQIQYRFLNAHWLLILGLLFLMDWLVASRHFAAGTLAGCALVYFVLWTWPRRWALDAFISIWLLASIIQSLGLGLWLLH
jgi:hypothetical protein